jgi:hypothetical protein
VSLASRLSLRCLFPPALPRIVHKERHLGQRDVCVSGGGGEGGWFGGLILIFLIRYVIVYQHYLVCDHLAMN